MRRFVAVFLVAVAVVGPAPSAVSPAAADDPDPLAVTYVAPVDGPLVDRFRPPETPYGPGNRGVDYGTAPGTPVLAAAPGEVVFAGAVGGALHVVVLHPDGIRTSYSFLQAVAVRRGDRVDQGARLGTAGASLHFGARVDDRYIDPLLLLDGALVDVFLVDAGPLAGLATEAAEGAALVRMLATDVARSDRGLALAAWAWPWGAATWWRGDAGPVAAVPAAVAGSELRRLAPLARLAAAAWRSGALPADVGDGVTRLGLALAAWHADRRDCTPASTPPPPVEGRRVAVLVAGLGSSSDTAGVWALADPAALGYADGRIVRFSYRGGTAADRPSGPADTEGDLWVAARRLRQLLHEIHAADPAARIDIVAHSQGGLVARAALALDLGVGPLDPFAVATLVTLATPHRGAALARVGADLGDAELSRRALDPLAAAFPGLPTPGAPAVAQLAEGSAFLRALAAEPLPATVTAVSVAARYDAVVPPDRARLPGARLVVVDSREVGLVASHHRLPSVTAARREVRLALAGRSPTCRPLGEYLTDAAVGALVRRLEYGATTLGRLAGAPPAGGLLDRGGGP